MIELSHVSKNYGKKLALRDVSLSFKSGKIYGLVGPNGSGKSTLLKMISGLVYPNSGEVKIQNRDITRMISEKVAYLSELDLFYFGFTVKRMIAFYDSQFQDFDMSKAHALLKDMKLDPTKKIKHLSKGNRGRLKLVLTLARKAPIILLDEPFSGLDPMVREAIAKSLITYIDFEKQTVIITTHEIDEVESLLDDIIIIYEGEIINQQNVETLREEKGLSVLRWFKMTMGSIEQQEEMYYGEETQ